MKDLYQKLNIEQFSELIPGAAASVYGRGQDFEDAYQQVLLLKGANLDQDGGFLTDGMEWGHIPLGKNIERYKLKEGDVVVMARGSAIRASLVDKLVENTRVIATANFIIVRPDAEVVKSEVLVAYLNSELGQASLLALSSGATVQHVPAGLLRNLEVPIPTKVKQEQIANIFHASKQAYKATLALAAQQKQASSAAMIGLMLGENP